MRVCSTAHQAETHKTKDPCLLTMRADYSVSDGQMWSLRGVGLLLYSSLESTDCDEGTGTLELNSNENLYII
jgi:hypothetical protein